MRIKNLQFFVFPDNTKPKGLLPRDRGAQACWYFYLLAQKVKERVGNSIDDQFGVLEGEPWMDKRYEQQARTVAMIYNLDSPDDFMRYWDAVRAEAERIGFPAPAPEYTKRIRMVH